MTSTTTTANTSHLDALSLNLWNERQRLAAATSASERELRSVWVAQLEKEAARERAHLGLPAVEDLPVISDDELLAELSEFGS